jgi:CRP/FNR family transcriptional regulator, cyclic AMP receptor protein
MTIASIDFQMLANAGFPPIRYAPGRCDFRRRRSRRRDVRRPQRQGTIERHGHFMEVLGGGGIFGEMALIDGSPRSATVHAKTDCEVVPINEKSFLFLVHETPYFAIAVMRTLAEPLRRMDDAV